MCETVKTQLKMDGQAMTIEELYKWAKKKGFEHYVMLLGESPKDGCVHLASVDDKQRRDEVVWLGDGY